MDAAYLVQARTNDGNMAVMYIDPPSAGAVTTGSSAPADSGKSKTGTSAASGQQAKAMTRKVHDSLEKAGFKDVMIVDAAFINPASVSGSSPSAPTDSPATSQPSK